MRSARRIVDKRWAMTSTSRPAAAARSERTKAFSAWRVEGGRRLVQDQGAGVADQAAGDAQALLTHAQRVAGLAEFGVEARGKVGDEVHRASGLAGPDQVVLGGFGINAATHFENASPRVSVLRER